MGNVLFDVVTNAKYKYSGNAISLFHSLSRSLFILKERVFDGLVHKDQVTTNLQKE